MNSEKYFSANYAEARARFTRAFTTAGARLSRYENKVATGVAGERLFLDVARLGPEDSPRLMVVGSGTHGVEGFCGSGCQLGIFHEKLQDRLPPDVGLLLVHAINPHGFSHCRRVNEDNVDINRNFVTPGKELAVNEHYDELHSYIVPGDWFGAAREEADEKIRVFIDNHGERAYQAAITGGQYNHPDGLFYGGDGPVWSNIVWQKIIRQHMSGAEHAFFMDVHTGIGPYGYGEPIFVDASYPDAFELGRTWFGDKLTRIGGDECISTVVEGPISNAMRWHLPDTRFMALSLEYGTRPVEKVLDALRADNWLYLHDDVTETQHELIKSSIRDAFYIEETQWKEMVWQRFVQVFDEAVGGLASL